MSHFKAKMHRTEFRLRLRRRPYWAAYSAPRTSSLDLIGSTSKGNERERGDEMGGEEREVRKRDCPPF